MSQKAAEKSMRRSYHTDLLRLSIAIQLRRFEEARVDSGDRDKRE